MRLSYLAIELDHQSVRGEVLDRNEWQRQERSGKNAEAAEEQDSGKTLEVARCSVRSCEVARRLGRVGFVLT